MKKQIQIVDLDIFLDFLCSINDNTRMEEWVYPIIVENIYHDEMEDFSMLSNIYIHVLCLKSMYCEH